VRLGEEATEMALPALRRAAGWQAGVRRKIKRIW
jgi:hypothetical protein